MRGGDRRGGPPGGGGRRGRGGPRREREPTPVRLPLYAEAREAAPALALSEERVTGHAGLWWNKFCDVWKEDWSGPDEQVIRPAGGGQAEIVRPGKLEWILSLLHRRGGERRVAREVGTEATITLGDPALLAEMRRRLEAMWQALGGTPRELELTAPFVTGTGLEHPTENGCVFHHTLGVPYLPASSLKGLLRAWAEAEGEAKVDMDRIFGPEAKGTALSVGSVIVFDALPVEPVKMAVEITTPHYQPWYQAERPAERPPADWYDPVPIPFLVVAPGARFLFAVAPRRPEEARDREDAEKVAEWLPEALAWLGAGAKTALGFGRFEEPEEQEKRVRQLEEERAKAPAPRAAETERRPPSRGAATTPPRPKAPGPLRDFPIGTRVVHIELGEEAEVVDYEGDRLVVEFGDGERETVSPREVRRVS